MQAHVDRQTWWNCILFHRSNQPFAWSIFQLNIVNGNCMHLIIASSHSLCHNPIGNVCVRQKLNRNVFSFSGHSSDSQSCKWVYAWYWNNFVVNACHIHFGKCLLPSNIDWIIREPIVCLHLLKMRTAGANIWNCIRKCLFKWISIWECCCRPQT